MSEYFPAHLNEAGQAHVRAELERLGLDWDVSATCSDIEGKISFGDLTKGNGNTMDYEIRNVDVGKSSYGVFGFIEIEADRHVHFREAVE